MEKLSFMTKDSQRTVCW